MKNKLKLGLQLALCLVPMICSGQAFLDGTNAVSLQHSNVVYRTNPGGAPAILIRGVAGGANAIELSTNAIETGFLSTDGFLSLGAGGTIQLYGPGGQASFDGLVEMISGFTNTGSANFSGNVTNHGLTASKLMRTTAGKGEASSAYDDADIALRQVGTAILSNLSSGTYNFTNVNVYASAATEVPMKVNGIADGVTNQFELKSSAGNLSYYVRSNFTVHAPLGSASDVAFGNTNNLGTGMFFPSLNNVAFAASSTIQAQLSNGAMDMGTTQISFGASVGTRDATIIRDASGALAQRSSTIPQTNSIYGTFTSSTSGEKLEMGYNGTHGWNFLQSNTNGAGTLRPFSLGVTTNSSITVDVTRGVTVKAAETNTVGLSIGPSGSLITNILTGSANLDFGSTSPGTNGVDLSITVTGTTTNDVCTLQAPPVVWNIRNAVWSATCSNDTVWVRLTNNGTNGAAAIDPGAAQFRVLVTKW